MYNVSNLRVAVVPVSEGIDQSSSVNAILANPFVELYPLTDYFKAQNDQDFDTSEVWTFLVDVREEIDWTGVNMDGIHQNLIEE
jgi:hypothetical protein